MNYKPSCQTLETMTRYEEIINAMKLLGEDMTMEYFILMQTFYLHNANDRLGINSLITTHNKASILSALC